MNWRLSSTETGSRTNARRSLQKMEERREQAAEAQLAVDAAARRWASSDRD